MIGRDVLRLARIGGHVEQFDLAPREPPLRLGIDLVTLAIRELPPAAGRGRLDEFPEASVVLRPHSPPPEQAPRRIVEVHDRVRVARAEHLLPRRHGLLVEQVHAWQAGGSLDPGGGEHRRQDVERRGERGAAPRGDHARPPQHDRRPQPAVVRRELRSGGELRRGRILDPAVVGDVHDERVGGELFRVEKIEQVADGLVEPLDVAPVAGHVPAVGLRCVVLDERLGRVVRIVRQHRRVPHEERRLPRAAVLDEVVHRLHRLAADGQALVAVPLALGHARVEPAAAKVSLPPLSGLERAVAVLAKEPRQRRPGLEHAVHPLAPRRKDLLSGW